MTREQFIRRRQADWERFEELTERAGARLVPKLWGEELADLSSLYRAICFDLSLVQSRDWGTSLTRYLNMLVGRGHHVLYRSKPGARLGVWRFLAEEFPSLLRANGWYFLVALALAVVPGLVSGILTAYHPEYASRLMPEAVQEQFEEMYSTSIADRYVDEDLSDPLNTRQAAEHEGQYGLMAGIYIQHNVGIAFRCFALGILFGIGTVKELVYNSIFLGAVTGYLIGQGHTRNFFEFVIGHGAFELTAIVIAGTAGLILGHALIHPGQRSRWEALQDRGVVAVKIALGAGVMLVIAAFIEGFWSPSPVPYAMKMGVGVFFWVLVIAYLSLAGRRKLSLESLNVRGAMDV